MSLPCRVPDEVSVPSTVRHSKPNTELTFWIERLLPHAAQIIAKNCLLSRDDGWSSSCDG